MQEMADSPTRVIDDYRAAVLAKDVDALVALYVDDVRVFDLWGQWSHEGIDAWRRVIAGWFGSLGTDRVVADFDDPRSFIHDDVAVVEAFVAFRAVSPDDVTLRSMNNRLTWVLRRTGEGWKIFHEHTSAPVDPATIKAILKR
jgi:uncharacterized protein (TIGR02246 family)